MSQAIVNVRMDSELKRNMESVCAALGINITTAVTMLAKKNG